MLFTIFTKVSQIKKFTAKLSPDYKPDLELRQINALRLYIMLNSLLNETALIYTTKSGFVSVRLADSGISPKPFLSNIGENV